MIDKFYDGIIDRYYADEQSSAHSQVGQLKYYNTLSVEEAIEDAVFGRYLVNEQQFFSYHYRFFFEIEGAQYSAREKLLANVSRIKDSIDFLELYIEVRRVTQDIERLGLLFYYDTALRIAASKEINLSPKHIFLQRGSLLGAQASGISLESYSDKKPYIGRVLFNSLSSKFKSMEPKDIESLLCVFHKEIKEKMEKL